MMDFRIADAFGNNAIKDTFNRAFREWKNNVTYCAELCIVMNMLCWYWYEKGNNERSRLYADCYYKVRDYGYDTFKEEELEYFYNQID